MLRYQVLGPVEVVDDGRVVELPGPRVRALLQALLLRVNQGVTIEELTSRIWPVEPPARPKHAIQTYIGRLRAALGEDVIRTTPRGYSIQLAADRLDMLRFQDLLSAATETDQAADRRAMLTEALSLWRGEITAEALDSPDLTRLGEDRLRALELLMDARLELGQSTEIVPALSGLTQEHPLRERFWAQLMLALYRSGRQADALAAYGQVSTILVEELGLDPGAELQQVHEAVLTGDAGPPGTPRVLAGNRWLMQCQLPLDIAGFVGRSEVLDEIVVMLSDSSPSRVVTISGAPGMGKTALAVHAAHLLRPAYPDGQWYLRMGGADGAPRPAAGLVAELLRLSGVDAASIPDGVDGRAAALRARLADRRVLLLLDDARDAEQVRPLLPGAGSSAVIITSRSQLGGLAALDGTHMILLDQLEADEGRRLVASAIGPQIAQEQSGAIDELIRLCGGLPLALRIAAASLEGRNAQDLTAYVRRLSDGNRLSRLSLPGDPRAAVRGAFALSYQALGPLERRAFRILGQLPGEDFSPASVAAMLEVAVDDAEELLGSIAAANLLQQRALGRYSFHDLLRLYAIELSADDPERAAAVHRLFAWYDERTAAVSGLDPDEPLLLTRSPAASNPFQDWESASEWLAAERRNVVAVAVTSADSEEPAYSWRLADATRRHLQQHGEIPLLRAAATAGLRAALRQRDDAAEGAMHVALETVATQEDGVATDALRHAEQAVACFRRANHDVATQITVNNLAVVHLMAGNALPAVEILRDCLASTKRVSLFSLTSVNLAEALVMVGRLGEAEQIASDALAAAPRWEPHTVELHLARLSARRLTGDLDQAISDLAAARGAVSETDAARRSGLLAYASALISADLGELDRALREAAIFARDTCRNTARWTKCLAMNTVGMVRLRRDEPEIALESYKQVQRIAFRYGYRAYEAEALTGLACSHRLLGQFAQAKSAAERSLALADQLGLKPTAAAAATALAGATSDLGDQTPVAALQERAALLRHEMGFPTVESSPSVSAGNRAS